MPVHLHQLALALNAYGNDHGGQLPPAYVTDTDVSDPYWPGVIFTTTLRPDWGELALLFRWPAEYAEVQGIHGMPYLPSAHVMVCPGETVGGPDGTFRLPWGLIGYTPGKGRTMAQAHNLGFAGYEYLYVPAPSWATAHPYLAGYAGVERYKLSTPNAASRSILAEFTLRYDNLFPDRFPGRHPSFWTHGHGGNVLYLDGHATWLPAENVRPLLTNLNLNDDRGVDVAWLKALDR